MNPVAIGGLILVAAGLTTVVTAEKAKRRALMLVAKPAASAGFLAVALGGGALDRSFGRWILAGLILSFLGDVFLMFSERVWFLSGLFSFLLAHVAYVAAFLVAGVSVAWTAVAGVGVLVVASVVMRWLLPHVPKDMRVPVLAYVVVISSMVSVGFGTLGDAHSAAIATGAVLFYLSDLFVARDRFVVEGFVNRLVGLPLYYGGQVLLALSVATAG